MQRPDAGDAALQEEGNARQTFAPEPFAIGEPDDEAREEEEEIDRQIALAQHADDVGGQKRASQADVEQHDHPGGDAAHAGERSKLRMRGQDSAANGSGARRAIGRHAVSLRLRERYVSSPICAPINSKTNGWKAIAMKAEPSR